MTNYEDYKEGDELRQVKAGEIPKIREYLMREKQNYICPLCGINMLNLTPKSRCVDHDHRKTTPNAGGIRGVLCSNCNGMEGKVRNAVVRAKRRGTEMQWIENLVAYWLKHETNQTGLIHPLHGKVKRRRKRLPVAVKAPTKPKG